MTGLLLISILFLLLGDSCILLSEGFECVSTKSGARRSSMNLRESSHSFPTVQETPLLSKKPLRGIIFDIDGTLVNSWKLGFDATQVVLENNGIPTISEETYHECTRYATPERLARHAGLLPSDEQFHKVGTKLAQEFDDLYVGLVDRDTAAFYDGIHKLLERLPSDVRVGALTNACVKYAEAVLRVNSVTAENDKNGSSKSIHGRFRSIRGADNVPSPKPSPDGLWVCCEEMGVSPEECIYVGDSPTDALAAQAAGMLSVGVLWGSNSQESLQKSPFTHLCHTVQELQSLVLSASLAGVYT